LNGSYEYSQELTVEVTHPVGFGLMQNYPNPFNPFTTIEYSLPEQAEVKILIYSILGEEVASLVNMTKEAGYHRYYLNADNLPSGTYIYQLKAAGVNSTYIETKKMIVLK
jgi:hypothetical protein